jgi:uncharacterized repeat protein (TIGR01451 family)
MMSLATLRVKGICPGVSRPQRLILCMFFCLFCLGFNTQAAYNIDGTLRDWGVSPLVDWEPDSVTANYIVTDDKNTYNVAGYDPAIFDVEALYFDDDATFFYFAVVTKFAFVVFSEGAPPIPRTGITGAGDLGLDFDISPQGIPNTDIGMNISQHGRVVMKGPPEDSTLGLDYGVRIGSTENGPLGQVVTQPSWNRTQYFYSESEGWQGGPWCMDDSPPESEIGSANIAFGMEGGSYIIEGAIPRHVFSEAADGGLVGLHITMSCGNDSANLVASYSSLQPPVQEFFPLDLKKEIVNAHRDEQQTPVVNPGDLIDYLITYASDRNTYPVTDVILVDAMPPEVSFVQALGSDAQGVYDPNEHTYTCTYPSLLPSASGAIHLQVRVHDDVAKGTIVTNTATIDSNETEPTTTTVNAIVEPAILDPLVISKVIQVGGEDANDQELRLVNVGEAITYAVCFTNPNSSMVTHVSLLDALPSEMTFLQATGDSDFGRYDPNTHTYNWILQSLNAGESLCLELTAQVKPFTPAFTRVVNRVTIDSDQTEASSAEVEALVKPIVYHPLNVSKRVSAVNDENVSVTIPLVEPGDLLTYEICFDNLSNDHLVQNLTVVDHLPAEVIFVNDDSMEVFGSYDPNTHSYTRRYPSLTPGAGTCFSLTVQVKDDVLPETLIRNDVTVHSDETEPNTATALALVRPHAQTLGLIKEIVRDTGNEADCFKPGDTITYQVCFANNDNDFPITGVSIVDTLPDELTFVTADGDSAFGRYDPNAHTYTWSYQSLAPGSAACLKLVVQVNQDTKPSTIITNSVTITTNETPPRTESIDFVTCQYEEPLEAELRIVKVSVVPRKRLTTIMVLVKLPQGNGAGDISAEPLVLNPGGTAATLQHAYTSGSRAKIIALFSGDGLLDAVPGYGPVKVTVTGKLKSGRLFYGEGTIVLSRLLGPRLR